MRTSSIIVFSILAVCFSFSIASAQECPKPWVLRLGISQYHETNPAVGVDYRWKEHNYAAVDWFETRSDDRIMLITGYRFDAGRLTPRVGVGAAKNDSWYFAWEGGGSYRFNDKLELYILYSKNGIEAHGEDGASWRFQLGFPF